MASLKGLRYKTLIEPTEGGYMQNYSRTTFLLLIILDYYPNFGIGDFVAGTTPVALIKQIFTFYSGLHLLILTDGFVFHQYL